MNKFLMDKFALTEQGARDITKSTFASFLMMLANLLPAILLMLFMDDLLNEHIRSRGFYFGASAAILLLMALLLSIEYEALYNATYKESANLRTALAQTLSKLPLSYFSKHDLSDLSQTVMSDIEGVEHAMSHAIPKVGAFFLFFPVMAVLLLGGNLKLGLAVLCPPLLKFCFLFLSKKVQRKGNLKHYQKLRENSEAFQEAIEMQQEIQSFHLSEEVREKMHRSMEESEEIHMQSETALILILGFSQIFDFIGLAVIIGVGVLLYSAGEISVLYLIGYLLAAMKIKDAVEGAGASIIEIFYIDPKVDRIKSIRNEKTQEGSDFDLQSFDIDLQEVSFSYDREIPVLNGVSFTARQGEVTALVGVSGCGKTSVLRLISRLYDYDGGKILIGGKDIKEISTDSLFAKTSIVFQDVTLFNASFLENIRVGRKDASDEEVKEAARLANCAEFIEKLPEGYESMIGENGAELSGGERQRLSIARAFLKNAPILILDEISAALDVENEKKIQESLSRLIRNKTVIIISHRLKSIEQADKIVVMDQGRVESIGSHDQLKEHSPIYRNLLENSKMAEDFSY